VVTQIHDLLAGAVMEDKSMLHTHFSRIYSVHLTGKFFHTRHWLGLIPQISLSWQIWVSWLSPWFSAMTVLQEDLKQDFCPSYHATDSINNTEDLPPNLPLEKILEIAGAVPKYPDNVYDRRQHTSWSCRVHDFVPSAIECSVLLRLVLGTICRSIDVRSAASLATFKRQLKTHLFKLSYRRWRFLFLMFPYCYVSLKLR